MHTILQDHVVSWITYTTEEPSLLSAESEENLALHRRVAEAVGVAIAPD